MSPQKVKSKSAGGQIVVEYLLLLVVAIAFISFAIKALVQRKEGPDGGAIIQVWNTMVTAIGNDEADEVK